MKAGFGPADELVTVNGAPVRPLDLLQAVIDRNMAKNRSRIPVQENHEIHFAIGHGVQNGKGLG